VVPVRYGLHSYIIATFGREVMSGRKSHEGAPHQDRLTGHWKTFHKTAEFLSLTGNASRANLTKFRKRSRTSKTSESQRKHCDSARPAGINEFRNGNMGV
jgi:hypothetical protein